MSNKTDLELLLPDNNNKEITPAKMRQAFDLVDYEQHADKIEEIGSFSNNMTPKFGVNIDLLVKSGYYEVDTNLPSGATVAELRVGYDTSNKNKIIQEFKDLNTPTVMRRISADNGANWSIWTNTAQTAFNLDMVDQVNAKASKEYVDGAMINTYAGTTVPDNAIGKSGDQYHRYSTSVPTILQGGICEESYDPKLFDIFFNSNPASGIMSISLKPSDRTVYLDWAIASEHSNNYSLEIDGSVIPLTIVTDTQLSVVATYTSGYDSVVQGIVVASTTFKLNTDVLSGIDEDYTKFGDRWFYTPIFDRTYDFKKAGISEGGNPVVISSTSYEDIVRLTTLPRYSGVYEYSFSITFGYSATSRSAMFQWSLDGGNSWEQFSLEVKDVTNKMPRTYKFPITRDQNGTIDLILQGKCEGASDTLTIDYASIVAERKG